MLAAITKFVPFIASASGAGKRWKEILIACLLVVIGYQNISDSRWALWADTIPYLKTEIANKSADIAKLSVELDIAEQANKTLVADIEQRNAEIERWSDVTKQLEANTSMLQEEISKIEIKSSSQIRTVEKQIIPQECSGAMHYLFDSIPELEYNEPSTDEKND